MCGPAPALRVACLGCLVDNLPAAQQRFVFAGMSLRRRDEPDSGGNEGQIPKTETVSTVLVAVTVPPALAASVLGLTLCPL